MKTSKAFTKTCMAMLFIMMTSSPVVAVADNPFVEIGAGKNYSFTNQSHPWDDGNGIAFYGRIGYSWELSDHVDVEVHYTHISQWFVGSPFNNDGESSVDHFGAAVRYNF